MKRVVEWQWEFGGLIAPIAGTGAWMVLAGLLMLSVALAWISYRNSWRKLAMGSRIALVALRSLLILFILLCLANPARVEKKYLDQADPRRLAVVVDRSDSMTQPDEDGRSRLDDAAARWRKLRQRAEGMGKPALFAFDRSLRTVPDFDAAVAKGTGEAPETRLFSSLEEVIGKVGDGSMAAVVCLTDGLDTTGGGFADLVAAARMAQAPLYFVIGKNRLRPEPVLHIRNFVVPATTLPNTRIAVRAVVEAYSPMPRTVPVRLLRDGAELARTEIELPRGNALKMWESELTTGPVAGSMPLELRVGEGTEAVSSRALTGVRENLVTRVLYFQGALDWGFRFFRDALAEDQNFEVTALFSPEIGVRLRPASTHGLNDLPATAGELAAFNLVVLSNVARDQLSEAQQLALLGYVRGGGGLLFILPDTEAAAEFSSTGLEAALPVAFGRPPAESAEDFASRRFQRMMEGTSQIGAEQQFAGGMAQRPLPVALHDFDIRPDTSLAKLFTEKSGGIEPKFASHAVIRRVKAGAEVLAMSEQGQALMVAQAFGRGRSTVMTTDTLWQWSLSQPSEAQTARTFWQQLVLWLAQPTNADLHFVDSFGKVTADTPLALRLESEAGEPPTVTLLSPTGSRQSLAVQREGDRIFRMDLTPDAVGRWSLIATDAKGLSVQANLEVTAREPVLETQVRPPDLARLRTIAESTGGQLLSGTVPPSWSRAREDSGSLLLSEKRSLLWDNWAVFVPLLGLYGAELLLRRRARLL